MGKNQFMLMKFSQKVGSDISSLERFHVYLINANEMMKNFKMRPRDLIQNCMFALHNYTLKIQKTKKISKLPQAFSIAELISEQWPHLI